MLRFCGLLRQITWGPAEATDDAVSMGLVRDALVAQDLIAEGRAR
jgi:hypothetical protein